MPRSLTVASVLLIAASMTAVAKKPLDLTWHDLSGRKVRLSDYRGKIVVVNFWATWCGPCRDEMPMMLEAEKAWAGRGVVFIAISLDDATFKKNIPAFVAKYGVDFPVWTGASSDDLDKLHLGEGVPDTAFLDESGAIVARVLGEVHRDEVDERLKWLTGDRKSRAPAAVVHHM